jgi:hypothetical protein
VYQYILFIEFKKYTYVTSYGELTTVDWLSARGWSDTTTTAISSLSSGCGLPGDDNFQGSVPAG